MPGTFTYGIELEGGWSGESMDNMPATQLDRFHGDGSVSIEDEVRHEGEWCSPAYNSIEDMIKHTERVWPDYYNSTCGMHIHVGMPKAVYCKFMEKSFYEAFIDQFLREAIECTKEPYKRLLVNRANGGNNYCLREWKSDVQATQTGKKGVRYAILNFCWALHKTMEIRVLPMMPHAQAAEVMTKLDKFLHSRAGSRGGRDFSLPAVIDQLSTQEKKKIKL